MIGFILVTRVSLGLPNLGTQIKSYQQELLSVIGLSSLGIRPSISRASEGCPRLAHEQACGPARMVLAAHVDNPHLRLPWLHWYFVSRDLC